jgi:hypothetical protein
MYKLASLKLTPEKMALLPEDVRSQIEEIKEATNNFEDDADVYALFKESDDIYFDIASKILKNAEKTTPSVVETKKETELKPKKEPKPKVKKEKPTPSVAEPKKEAMTEKPTNVEKSVIPTKEEMLKATQRRSPDAVKKLRKVAIKCGLYASENTSSKPKVIPFGVGELVAHTGDFILYLGDGYPFTVIRKEDIKTLCITIGADEKLLLRTKKPDGAKSKIKTDKVTGEVIKTAAKPKKRRMTDKTSEGISKLAAKMNADGCDVARFTRETAGTPIDAAIWGKVAEWNKKKDLEKIVRVGIGKEDTEFEGEFIAQTVDYSEIFRSIRYYKVCADRGIWTRLSKQDEDKAEKAFDNREFQIQYAKAEINRLYNYGDPSVKKYDEKMMACKSMAQEAYSLRKEGKKEEARPKYQEIYNTCRNQVLNEYNRDYLIDFNELVRKHREENKSLTWAEARKEVKKDLLEKAAKMAA